MQELADSGIDIIAAQENADVDNWSPEGWNRWRPKRARSTTIYWNPNTVNQIKKGHKRLSSLTFPSYRGITWSIFETEIGVLQVASAHLPAFKTSKPRNAKEFKKQEQKLANWLNYRDYRIVAGDINATIPGVKWTPNLTMVGRWTEPVPSGPHDTKIDYVGVNGLGPYCISETELKPEGRSDHHPVVATIERR